jgi:hypothetical protein
MTVIVLTSGSSWSVPLDWNNSANTIECIGGGSSANNTGTAVNRASGAGGAYAKKSNVSLTPGGSVSYSIGAGGAGLALTNNTSNPGGDTWFGSTGTVLAKGAAAVVTAGVGAIGGQASGCVGDLTYSGGNGIGNFNPNNGGGGAAGPNGNGGNGSTTAGGSADGGTVAGPTSNGAGNSGSEWTSSPGGVTVGCGTGGFTTSSPQPGGLYGGGGATRGNGTSGAGAKGLIVITYTPVTSKVFLAGTNVTKMYLGSDLVSAAYLGSDKVF